METKFEQFLKEEAPILVSEFGNEIVFSLEQFLNALFFILFNG